MNKKISVGAAAALIIIAVALTVSVTMVIAMRHFNYTMSNVSQRQAMFDYITDVDKEVRQNHLGDINEGTLRAALAKGYLDGMDDPYAAYLTAAEYRKEAERLSGKCTGLGLEIAKQTDGSIVITAVHKNSAADKAGIQKGDVITQLNGAVVNASSFAQVRSTLANAEKAMITVNRKSDSIAFEISASTYTIISVESRMIDTTGYIRISAFYSNTPDQFKDAFTALEAQGAQNYIFDLRYNKGGDLDAAGNVIGYLIPRGTYARRMATDGTTDLTSTGAFEITKPSVTLVNAVTEGEAELFAGVMQEFKKTTVVGVKTAGRGMVQQFYTLRADGAAIKISVASLSLASGGILEGVGVTPAVTVALTSEQENRFPFLTEKDDTQILAAITTLKGGAVTTTTTAATSSATTAATATTASATTKAP